MLISIDENNKVVWYNTYITQEESAKWFNEHTFWTNATVPEHEEHTGKVAVLYWENNMLVWKYEEKPGPEPEPAQPTNQDIMDKLNTMTTGQVSTAELDAAYREGVNAYE